MFKFLEDFYKRNSSVDLDKIGQLLFISLVLIVGIAVFGIGTGVSWDRAKALEITCMTNMKILALDLRTYASTNNGLLPSGTNWCDALNSFENSRKAFRCPPRQGKLASYAFNANLSGLNTTNVNPATVLLFESDKGWNAVGGLELMTNRHERAIVCFADGSVRRLPKSELKSLRWEP